MDRLVPICILEVQGGQPGTRPEMESYLCYCHHPELPGDNKLVEHTEVNDEVIFQGVTLWDGEGAREEQGRGQVLHNLHRQYFVEVGNDLGRDLG